MRLATHRFPGYIVTDHEFTVPLDYTRPAGESITIFARELTTPDRAHADLPWLIFFQGGPGFGSPRPDGSQGWIERAARDFRVLLIDQRGTARSTPINHQTLARFSSPIEQAAYLKHFRADNIVRDAEHIRRELIGSERWSALGQSYGGFIITTYLSLAADGLREAFITGGLPPIDHHPDDVYRRTYPRVRAKNQRYFQRYPGDAELVHDIAAYLSTHDVRLPGGDPLSVRRLQQLGAPFGMSDGFEKVHYLLEDAFVRGAGGLELNYAFLRGVENAQSFDTDPIYAILHEPIYCEGAAANWSAERIRAEFPEFNYAPDRPLLFTGEMIYPWMFDEYTALRPLKAAAEVLAADADWPRLYDRAALQANTVPVAAAVYYDDMYVDRTLSEETASYLNGVRLWITNEYEHNGLRFDGARILSRLMDMARGKA